MTDEIQAWLTKQWQDWLSEQWQEADPQRFEITMKTFDAIRAVDAIHVAHKIYDECDHQHDPDDPNTIDLVDFVTCAASLMYEICRACCTAGFDNDQTEECASDHRHGPGLAICPTNAAIGRAVIGRAYGHKPEPASC